MTLTVTIPDDVEAQKRETLAVALYDARAISQGQAAQIAGVSRAEFIYALERHGITPFQYDSAEELLAEAGLLPERA